MRRRRSIALTMLVITGVINYVDRSTLSIAEQPICEELGLTNTEMGFLLSAFSWSYAFAIAHRRPGRQGRPANLARRGARTLVSGAGVRRIGYQHATVRRHAHCAWHRRSTSVSRGARVVSNWYHIRERGLPTGMFNSSSSLGPAWRPPLVMLMAAFGWRRMFFIMGALGLLTALVWYIFYRDPQQAGLSEDGLRSLWPTNLLRLARSLWQNGCACSDTGRPGEWCSASPALSTSSGST